MIDHCGGLRQAGSGSLGCTSAKAFQVNLVHSPYEHNNPRYLLLLATMGSKKKTKKGASQLPPVEPPPAVQDDDLMDDLFAQLDSKDQTVQAESAAVINEMSLNDAVDDAETKAKQDSKSRHKARMVCDFARNLRRSRFLINSPLGEKSCSFGGEIRPFRY